MSTERTEHPYLRDGWSIRPPELVPDVNPADEVVARMRKRVYGSERGNVISGLPGSDGKSGSAGSAGAGGAGGGSGGSGSSGGDGISGPGGGSGTATLGGRVSDAEAAIESLQTQITDASISAECNGDGTITVTLTWG